MKLPFPAPIVGVTATREGGTLPQVEAATALFAGMSIGGPIEFHHGDCVGGDAQLHALARRAGWRTVAWPSSTGPAYWAHTENDVTKDRRSPLSRNRWIVKSASVLVAMPMRPIPWHMDWEGGMGGTVYTAMYARLNETPVIEILPDGRLSYVEPC